MGKCIVKGHRPSQGLLDLVQPVTLVFPVAQLGNHDDGATLVLVQLEQVAGWQGFRPQANAARTREGGSESFCTGGPGRFFLQPRTRWLL
jgi:hypothetical protein